MARTATLIFGGLILLLLAANPAPGAIVNVVADNGNAASVIEKTNNAVMFQVEPFVNRKPVVVEVELQPGETGPIKFSAAFKNGTGYRWHDFHLTLKGGAKWQKVNRIDPDPRLQVNKDLGMEITITDTTVDMRFGEGPINNNSQIEVGFPQSSFMTCPMMIGS